jgi:urease accessory protein
MTESRLALRGGATVLLALFSASALAHATAKGVNDFQAGLLHPLTALENVLPFLALGLLVGQHGARTKNALPVFWTALILGAVLAMWLPAVPHVDLINVSSMLVLGILVASALPLPPLVYLGLVVLFGLSHGYANGVEIAPPVRAYLFIPGVALGALVLNGLGLVITEYATRSKIGWMSIAVRVAGSWIAAIGLLVLANEWPRLVA